MKLLTLPAVLLFAVLPALADSFKVTDSLKETNPFDVFVLEITPHGQVGIQLTPNGNPLVLSFGPPPYEVEFIVPVFNSTIPEATLSVELTIAGQLTDTFQATQDCPPVCGFGLALFSVSSQKRSPV